MACERCAEALRKVQVVLEERGLAGEFPELATLHASLLKDEPADALEKGGQALLELAMFDIDSLPPGVPWAAVAARLVLKAADLRKQTASPDLL